MIGVHDTECYKIGADVMGIEETQVFIPGSKLASAAASAIKRHSECRAEIVLAGTAHILSCLEMPEASRNALMHFLGASAKAMDASFC
jgi:hypothetical protein